MKQEKAEMIALLAVLLIAVVSLLLIALDRYREKHAHR